MMSPNESQELAKRTECKQPQSLKRMMSHRNTDINLLVDNDYPDLVPIRVNHGIIGLAGEVGELACQLQKWIYYGKELDKNNIKEELGDCLWYIALVCNALDFNLEDIMQANIAKLKARYPEKYTDTLAAEENRNREQEKKALVMHLVEWKTSLGSPFAYITPDNYLVINMEEIKKESPKNKGFRQLCKKLIELGFQIKDD